MAIVRHKQPLLRRIAMIIRMDHVADIRHGEGI